MAQLEVKVKQECSLLSFLKEKTKLSNREIKQALEQGGCRLNGKIERFASTSLVPGDTLAFRLPEKASQEKYAILHQDTSLTLFNKPSGLITEAPHGHFLVHRLDKGTSGVILMARTLSMKNSLELLFRKKEIKKIYIALVQGIPKKKEGTIATSLAKKGTFHGQTLYGSAPHGKEAITHYKVLKKRKGFSLIELHPETGRTHQLRVHMAEMGHPILGDLQYGRDVSFSHDVNRLCLHAYRLSFKHPKTGQMVQALAPLPALFKKLMGI